ncbi:MAG: DUF4349 domain-containing protein [Chloroflexi bacterium]|nr:DUF4349 domain-containing protein [Chloroflexota bacterium]
MQRFRAAFIVLVVVALMACGEDESSAESLDFDERAMAEPAMAMAAESEAIVVKEVPVEVEVIREVPVEVVVEKMVTAAPAPAAMPASAAPQSLDSAPQSVDTGVVERQIIRTGTLSVVVAELSAAVTQVEDIVAGISGAFVAASNIQQDDPRRVSTITVRVPVETFDATLAALRNVGAEVIDEDIRSQDVTAQYTDLTARLRNATAAEQQLLDILTRAQNVQDTIEVQRELTDVRERIEVLQGQLNVLTNQTSLATIVLRLHPAADLIVMREIPSHFRMHDSTSLSLSVWNEGTVDLKQVEVVDRLDPGMIFLAASDGGVYSAAAHTVSWTIDRLGPGDARFLSSDVRLESEALEMQARAEVSTSSPEGDGANNRAEAALTFHVDLSIFKDGPAAVPVGRDVAYTLEYRNSGNTDARNVRLEERLSEGMQFVRADGGGRFDDARNAIVWEFPRIAPGLADIVTYVARVEADSGRLQTDTSIKSDEPDRADVDNTSTTFLTVLPEDVADRDVWNPGSTARESVDRLGRFAQWAADAGLTIAIIGGPMLVVVAILVAAVRAVGRRRSA